MIEMGCSSDNESTTPAAFALTSPSFKSGDKIPDKFTCEGLPFGGGISPALNWTPGPAATKSYALILKDTSLSTKSPPDPHGFHWIMWSIPAGTHSLPEAMGGDQHPASPAGSEQYSGYPGPRATDGTDPQPYQYLGPCPSVGAAISGNDADRSNDNYAFVLYAVDKDVLDLPTQDPMANWAQPLDEYFDSIAIAQTELTGTSNAKPTAPPPG